MKKQIKKGFTLVELLVVIAIIAILSVVSVVGYTSFTKKAKVSKDLSLTTEMNTILQGEEASGEKFNTAHEAVVALEEGGLNVSKLTPTTNGYNYVYDIKQNRMFLLDEDFNKIAPSDLELSDDKENLFAFVSSVSEMNNFDGAYSYYLKSGFSMSSTSSKASTTSAIKVMSNTNSISSNTLTITNGGGIDVGANKNINITYNCEVSNNIVIRTQGDQTVLTINTTSQANSVLTLYGFAKSVTIASANSGVSVAGSCSELKVSSGSVTVEETGIVFKVIASTNIINNGYIAETADSTKISGNTVGGNLQISSLEQLETFRDTVNAGATFEGKTVELTKDITLKNGWNPIGEGYRKIAKESSSQSNGTFFQGTFDGKNHTISNLNNIGYVPTSSRLVLDDNNYSYCYGLFALVKNATITNLKLTNVNIDQSRYTDAYMDSVGGLVGYAEASNTISNISVAGSIVCKDSAGGIIGRWYGYVENGQGVITNCTNNASINATEKASGIVGWAAAKTGILTIKVENCINNGNVEATEGAGALVTTYNGTATFEVSNFKNNVKLTGGKDSAFNGILETGTYNSIK